MYIINRGEKLLLNIIDLNARLNRVKMPFAVVWLIVTFSTTLSIVPQLCVPCSGAPPCAFISLTSLRRSSSRSVSVVLF